MVYNDGKNELQYMAVLFAEKGFMSIASLSIATGKRQEGGQE